MKRKISLVILTAALALASAIGLAACDDEQNTSCTEHAWDSGNVTREATCAEAGETTYTCTVCGETKTEPIAKSTTHSWDAGEVDQPDITVEGSITYTCTVCGDTYSETVPAHVEHEWDEGSQLKAPTCTEKGSMKYECKICHTTKTEDISATGEHHYDTFVGYVTEPTCITAGSATYKCMTCEATTTKEVSATGEHHYDMFVKYVTEPTCVEKGSAIYQCITCTATTTKEVQPTGNHALSWEHEGEQHWQKCANCDYATDKEAHVWTETDRRDADCVTDGWVKCECKCGAEKTEDISATGEHHYDTFVRYVTEPTCGTAGSAIYKCTTCEETTTKEVQPTGVHSLGDWLIDTEATLYQTGSRHKECSACDYKTSVESYELDNFVSDYRSGIVSENTSGWEYGHSDYNWSAPTEGRLPGSTDNDESFVFTKSEEFNGDAWLVKNNNNEVISEIKAGWLNGSWSTLAYTVGEGVENASYTLALGYKYNPADSHKDLYTAANVRIAVLSQDRTCKYSEFIHLDGHGTNEAREISGLNTGDKIYVFIEFEEEKEKDGDNVTNSSWSNGDFTCRIFEKQPEQTQDE